MQTLVQKALKNRRNTIAPMSNMRSLEDSVTFARIWIDGYEIGGYLTYTALDAKSYFTEPVRSLDGTIENLNAYPTFLTPQVTIEFKYMKIETYRTIIKIIQERNEHIVKYYDIVQDKMVTKKMYFKPEQLPTIFQRRLEILAVTNYKIELVGTNADLNSYNIQYHLNPPEDSGVEDIPPVGSDNYVSGEEVVIGEGDGAASIRDNASMIGAGYSFASWNTSPDGTGVKYLDGYAYTLNDTSTENGVFNLYAIWDKHNAYTLSYNYGVAKAYIDTGTNQELTSKDITYNDPYGTLPNTTPDPVEFQDNEYQPYSNGGWYKNPVKTYTENPDGSVVVANKVEPTTLYTVKGNSTIYQLFDVAEYTISFVMNGAEVPTQPYSNITAPYGAYVAKPPDPTKTGFVFDGWWTTADFQEGTMYTFNTMPPVSITLYAKWVEDEEE